MARRRVKPVKLSHQELLRQRRLPMPRPTQVTPDPKRRARGPRIKVVAPEYDPHHDDGEPC